MITEVETNRARPKGEGLLDIRDLAEYWGLDDLEELKRFIRSQGVPYFSLGRSARERIRWDRIRFRMDAIRRWEEQNQCVYAERMAEPAAPEEEGRPKSRLRCRKR